MNAPIYFSENPTDPFFYLSNSSPHEFYDNGVCWKTVEHYFQAHKFIDRPEIFLLLANATTPKDAYHLGHSFPLIEGWNDVKYQVMFDGVSRKFEAHGDICELLIATDDRILVKAHPKDYYWGCGADRTGSNWLGKILVIIRDKMKVIRDQGL